MWRVSKVVYRYKHLLFCDHFTLCSLQRLNASLNLSRYRNAVMVIQKCAAPFCQENWTRKQGKLRPKFKSWRRTSTCGEETMENESFIFNKQFLSLAFHRFCKRNIKLQMHSLYGCVQFLFSFECVNNSEYKQASRKQDWL